MRRLIFFRLLAVFMMLVYGCTIKPPDVVITSEKTALENQLLGSSEIITDDPLSITAIWSRDFQHDLYDSTISVAIDTVNAANVRRLVLAQVRRQTIQDHINQLKRSGVLGERANGFIAVMADTLSEYDEIGRIVAAENTDRKIIWEFYTAAGSDDDFEKALLSVREEFAGIMQKVSPTGTWIEDSKGNWKIK
jgi:hypothetical protein